MANSSGKTYVSKGLYRNVSRKIVNLMRSERRKNPPIEDLIKKREARQLIISKPRTAKQKELRERYLEEERIEHQSYLLIDQYKDVGLSRGEAIHAVKTHFVDQLHAKWGPRLKALREAEKKKK